MKQKKMFVAVAGNIGVGKSSLTQRMAEALQWQPFFEAVDENPYLADFYENMARWSFHSQVYFLARRLKHHRQLLDHPGNVIQDRSIYEDAEIFAENLYRQSKLSERDYRCYRNLYDGICDFLPPPDLIIYLKASVGMLAERIAIRGRDYERQISIAYLAELNEIYNEWELKWSRCPILTIETDHIDFVHQSEDLEAILNQIRTYISSL